jgi:PAS domain S-box-containing protein
MDSEVQMEIIDQRDYYSGIMGSLKEGVIVLDRDLTITDVNQFFMIFFDRDKSGIIGQKCHSLLNGRNEPCPDCYLLKSQIFEKGKDCSTDCSFPNFEGESYHFRVSGTPLEMQDEEISTVLLTFSDVTRLERLSRYLEASASVASLLLKGGNVASLVNDVLEIVGRRAGASRCYWFENHEDEAGRICASQRAEWSADGAAAGAGNPQQQNLAYENAFPNWYGDLFEGRYVLGVVDDFEEEERTFLEKRDVRSICIVPLIINEAFRGFVGFDNCVSHTPWQEAEVNLLNSAADSLAKAFEHEESLRELKESEARYRDVFENIYDIWYLHDMEGQILEANPALERTVGRLEEGLLSMNIRDLIPERHRSAFGDYLGGLREKGKAEGLIRIFTEQGKERVLEYRNWLIDLPDGKKVCRGLARDVTEREELQLQLRQAQKMESIGTLATGISHNFRNILAGVMTHCQLMQIKYRDIPKFQEYSDEIIRLTKTGSDMINDLLQFSRKGYRESKHVINMTDILREVHRIIARSFDKKIDIKTDWPDLLPIYGPRSSLSQVLMNLCTNARDSMPEGGTLYMTAREENDRVAVSITDSGCGMDEETLKKIFDPFFTTKEVGKGTGLGLATAYGIVKDLGGDIQVKSRPGEGSSFDLFFRLADTPAPETKESVPVFVQGGGEKILVVDDDEILLESFEELLSSLGYTADSAPDGEKALEIYGNWRPKVVLLDRNMPGMDGLATSEAILSIDPDARIILLSGYEDAGDEGIDASVRRYIKAYLTKPVDISDLSRVLSEVIGK